MAWSARTGGMDLERVRAELDHWRRSPGRGRGIPEEIWQGVVQLSQSRGIYRIARELRLNYQSLQRRLAAGGNDPGKTAAVTPPVFLDLGTGVLNATAECVVDILSPDGARMTVRLSASVPESLAALSSGFWRKG